MLPWSCDSSVGSFLTAPYQIQAGRDIDLIRCSDGRGNETRRVHHTYLLL